MPSTNRKILLKVAHLILTAVNLVVFMGIFCVKAKRMSFPSYGLRVVGSLEYYSVLELTPCIVSCISLCSD